MTNNEKFKTDASELLDKIIKFKRNYGIFSSRNGAALDLFERELRLTLTIARSDEENKNQSNKDSFC